MRLLLLGACGQLGQAFSSILSSKNQGWQLYALEKGDCDLCNQPALLAFIGRVKPDVIINAAAYTQVDQAEAEPEVAYRINAQAVAALAEAARLVEALLVHFSTDYVFDGSGDNPWREEDKPAPLNIYGMSKWQGEQAILASGCRHLIFRTSWLYSPYRQNFLKTMLYLGQERKSLSVICDQIGVPTSAISLAGVTLLAIRQALVNPALDGLYHTVAAGEVSWYNYAHFIFDKARKLGVELKLNELKPVLSRDYSIIAKRPLNSRLDTYKFYAAFGISLPDWRVGVGETLFQLIRRRSGY